MCMLLQNWQHMQLAYCGSAAMKYAQPLAADNGLSVFACSLLPLPTNILSRYFQCSMC